MSLHLYHLYFSQNVDMTRELQIRRIRGFQKSTAATFILLTAPVNPTLIRPESINTEKNDVISTNSLIFGTLQTPDLHRTNALHVVFRLFREVTMIIR